MKSITLPLLTLALLLLVHSTYSQQCLSACPAGLTTCSRIQYNLFVDNTSAVAASEARITKFLYEAARLSAFAAKFPDAPKCYSFLQNFMCNANHPSCDPNSPSPTPIPMCYDMCLNLNNICGSIEKYLPPYVQKFFNCEGEGLYGPYYTTNNESCSRVVTPTQSPPPSCPGNASPRVNSYTGVCTKFNASAAPVIYDYCAPFVSDTVYVPFSWPQTVAFLDDLVADVILAAQHFYPVSPQKCHKHIFSISCRVVFPSCESVYVPYYDATVGVPIRPCRTFCETANEKCYDFFTKSNSTNFFANCATYQNATYNTTVAPGMVITEKCNSDLYPPGAMMPYVIPDAVCPPETGRKIIRSDEDSYCDLRCPDASYSLNEWERLTRLTNSGAAFSLAAMTFLTLSYLLQYERRKFPSSIHFWEFVATALFAVSFLIGGTAPEKKVWCYDEGTNATQENNARCGVQGFFFIFFGIALTSWCCVIAFLMFYAIVFNKKIKNMQKYSPMFHLFGWGVPMVFAVAAAATKSIGYGPPLAWCFIHFDGFGFSSGGISKDYIFFYIPEAVLFFSIIFMFVCTVAKIIYVRQRHISNSSVARKGSRTFKAQVRVLIFIFVVFIICLTIFQWRLQIQGNTTIAAVGLQWTYCKIKTSLGIPTSAVCTGDTNPARVDYAHTAVESFLLSGIGLLIFVGFGADPNIYRHWFKMAKLTYARDFAKLKDLILHGKDPFGTLSRTASKTSRVSKTSTDTHTPPSNPGQGTTGSSIEKSRSQLSKGVTTTSDSDFEDSLSIELAVDGEKQLKNGDLYVL